MGPLTTATAEGTERDEYRTPREIFDGLDCQFDLDPCKPSYGPWFVTADAGYTREDDGLKKEWRGLVWMNPPFGKRNGQVPWLERFFEHGDGIGLVNALTSSGWFHDWMPKASGLFLPRGKTQFVRPDGTVAKQPASGAVLFSAGERGRDVLRQATLAGMFFDV
jgi:hypothetical protein